MSPPSVKKGAIYADLLGPENITGEIVDGDLYTTPRPGPRHVVAQADVTQNALTEYHRALKQSGAGASVVARKASGEEATLLTPERAILEGQGVRHTPAELKRLATDLASARGPKAAAHIRERMTRGFYGI